MKKIFQFYVTSAKKAFQDLLRCWIILPASTLAYFLYLFIVQFVAPFGIAGGFIIWIVEMALLTLYYSWLSEASSRQRLNTGNMFEIDSQLFFDIISVAFILYIAKYLVEGFARSIPDLEFLPLFMQLTIVVIFNALPEVLYLSRERSLSALEHAARFTKQYWIEWFLPYIILILPVIILLQKIAVALLATSDELLPIRVVMQAWIIYGGAGSYSALLFSLIGLILGTWFMLFRAHLFEQLD